MDTTRNSLIIPLNPTLTTLIERAEKALVDYITKETERLLGDAFERFATFPEGTRYDYAPVFVKLNIIKDYVIHLDIYIPHYCVKINFDNSGPNIASNQKTLFIEGRAYLSLFSSSNVGVVHLGYGDKPLFFEASSLARVIEDEVLS